VIVPAETTISTWTGPYWVCAVVPSNVPETVAAFEEEDPDVEEGVDADGVELGVDVEDEPEPDDVEDELPDVPLVAGAPLDEVAVTWLAPICHPMSRTEAEAKTPPAMARGLMS
jgi:hypothetical protein